MSLTFTQLFGYGEIKNCSRIVAELRHSGKTIDDLLEYARYIKGDEVKSVVKGPQFALRIRKSDLGSRDDLLAAVGWQNLRAWGKIKKLLDKFGVSYEEAHKFGNSGWKADLEQTKSGFVPE